MKITHTSKVKQASEKINNMKLENWRKIFHKCYLIYFESYYIFSLVFLAFTGLYLLLDRFYKGLLLWNCYCWKAIVKACVSFHQKKKTKTKTRTLKLAQIFNTSTIVSREPKCSWLNDCFFHLLLLFVHSGKQPLALIWPEQNNYKNDAFFSVIIIDMTKHIHILCLSNFCVHLLFR